MITPALEILLFVVGWSAAAAAMLWGMLRIARYHHRPAPRPRPQHQAAAPQPLSVSLSA